MKWFSYEEVAHHGYGEPYAVEKYVINPRRFKERDGIRWYESGLVEIHDDVTNNPRRRSYHYREYGLDWRLKSDMVDLQFYTPEGEPVHKNAIDNDGVFLLDHKHGMVLQALPWRGYKITYYSEHARPTGSYPLKVSVPDMSAAKEMVKRRADELSLCLTVAALADQNRPVPYAPSAALAFSQTPDLFTCHHTTQVMIGSSLQDSKQRFINALARQVGSTPQVPFLYFKEKA